MNNRIGNFMKESRILAFFINFNKNLIEYFYNSQVYKYSLKINIFFKDVFLKNMNRSLIVASIKNIARNTKTKDIGIFILLVVLFNTLAMYALGEKIDIFSSIARILFFISGLILILKKE